MAHRAIALRLGDAPSIRALYRFRFGRNIAGWSTEVSATLFAQGSSRSCGPSPFILEALSRLRTEFMERGGMLNLALVL